MIRVIEFIWVNWLEILFISLTRVIAKAAASFKATITEIRKLRQTHIQTAIMHIMATLVAPAATVAVGVW